MAAGGAALKLIAAVHDMGDEEVNQRLELGLKKQVVKKDDHKTEIFIIYSHPSSSQQHQFPSSTHP